MNDNRERKVNGGDPLIRRTRRISGTCEKLSWFLSVLGIVNVGIGLIASLIGDYRSEKLRKGGCHGR